MEPILTACVHGQRWESCTIADCQEIWRLHLQSVQEERREANDWAYARKARKGRGNRKSEYQTALETTGAPNGNDDEIRVAGDEVIPKPELPRAKKRFREVFPDEMTLRAALQFRAVTLRQAQLLEAYFESD